MPASKRYRNVPVLGELDVATFDSTMLTLTQWVSPQVGCSHCHVDGDWASETKPAKQVARQMLQMVQGINTNWKPHVSPSGVTCYTCHRGQPQPPAVSSLALNTVTLAAAHQARAASGLRMLRDINTDALAAAPGGPSTAPTTCATCHQGARRPGADGAPLARDHAALTLVPIERDSSGPARTVPVRLAPGVDACAAAATAAARAGTRIAADAGLRPVIGAQALVLYAAPDTACAMLDLHLRDGDTVEAYVNHAGYTSVRYRRPATGSEARGWVRSDRLGPGSSVNLASAPNAAVGRVQAATALPAHGCQAPEAGDAAGRHLARAQRQVLGKGRLQFYSAPDETCPLRGIFILPGEPVVTLQQSARFTAVHYVNPRTGGQASGWVLSERLGGS